MKFIVDTQLPPRLAKFLAEEGFETIHTIHFPDGHLLDDGTIWEIAASEDRIVITKDADFLTATSKSGFGNRHGTVFKSGMYPIEDLNTCWMIRFQ